MQGISHNQQVTYDQMGGEVRIPRHPRIISLVPSQTELLFDLGLEDQIVGVTKFCIHPHPKVKEKPIVGGTKNFRFERIDELRPNLIIGNKEENYPEGINKLKEKYPVWMSDIITLEDALAMIAALGQLTNTSPKATSLISEIRKGMKDLPSFGSKRVLYFIWQNPWMVAGRNTFIDHMLSQLGLINIARKMDRYPELQSEELQALQPDIILLSSEPYPFKDQHITEFQLLCPEADVRLVDGEMFSWYGSRLLKAMDYFRQLNL